SEHTPDRSVHQLVAAHGFDVIVPDLRQNLDEALDIRIGVVVRFLDSSDRPRARDQSDDEDAYRDDLPSIHGRFTSVRWESGRSRSGAHPPRFDARESLPETYPAVPQSVPAHAARSPNNARGRLRRTPGFPIRSGPAARPYAASPSRARPRSGRRSSRSGPA